MRVLILGAAGQLGRAIVETAPIGVELLAWTRADIDMARPDTIGRAISMAAPEVCINCAAYVAVDRAESEEALAHRVNGEAVGALAESLRSNGGRLIQVSTDFVFDGRITRPYRPSDTRNPLSAYGRSKVAGELLVGERDAVVRTSWLYGLGGANFVATMLNLMRTRPQLRVVTDQIGAPTWTGGLARAIWRLIDANLTGIWHWSDAGVASWYDFAQSIHDLALGMGLLQRPVLIAPITTAEFATPAHRPAFSLLDSSATRDVLNLPAVHWRHNLAIHLDQARAVESTR